MNRREFIKLSAITAITLFSSTSFIGKFIYKPAQVLAGSKLFKGTLNGKIFVSKDSGRGWEQLTNFGEDISIIDLRVDHSTQVYALLGYKDFIFHLKLAPDGRNWVSV